jgi:hypothetical protein
LIFSFFISSQIIQKILKFLKKFISKEKELNLFIVYIHKKLIDIIDKIHKNNQKNKLRFLALL